MLWVDPLIRPRPVMPNPGVAVPAILELKLQIAVTAARYYSSVGRVVESGIMSWARVKQFRSLSDVTLNWTDSPPLPELGRSVPIMKLLELTRDYLRGRLGIRQIPLSYVVRGNVTPILIVDDPIHATKPHSSNYVGFHDELIARASHDHVNFVEDNASVLDILVGALKATPHMTSLKPFLRS